MDKVYISAQQLLEDAFDLAVKIHQSGFKPDYIVGVWRGGAPVGIAVQELMQVMGVSADHIAIRTSSYSGINQREKEVQVHGLTYLVKRVESHQKLLIVDDVHDSGLSINQIIIELEKACKKNTPEIRVATPYFKPENNKTDRVPDYYLHSCTEWLVFPHEIDGLSDEELRTHRPELSRILDYLQSVREQ